MKGMHPIVIQQIVERAMIGARVTDPVYPVRERRFRRRGTS
jgi:hypothetical protein